MDYAVNRGNNSIKHSACIIEKSIGFIKLDDIITTNESPLHGGDSGVGIMKKRQIIPYN